MAMLEVEVKCPKAVALDVSFANGKRISLPPGGSTRALLTGDEVGKVQAGFTAAVKQAKREGAMDEDVKGGGVSILTKGYDEVPVGSKKHRAMHPDEYEGESAVHKAEGKPAKAPKPAKGEKDKV